MYEIRKFYLTNSMTVQELFDVFTGVCEKFPSTTEKQKEMLAAWNASMARAKEHAFPIYHAVDSRVEKGNYHEVGLLNVEGLGIVGVMVLDKGYHIINAITLKMNIDAFAIYSTVPAWQAKFGPEETKKIFDTLTKLILMECTERSISLELIKDESKWSWILRKTKMLEVSYSSIFL